MLSNFVLSQLLLTMSITPLLLHEDHPSFAIAYRRTISPQKPQKYSSKALSNFIEEDEIKQKKARISNSNSLDPDSIYMIIWRIVNIICIYIYLFELPIALVFENTRRDRAHVGYLFEIINGPCMMIFVINMIIKMKLPYYKDGLLITDSRQIVKNYLKFMLPLDIISISTIAAYEISTLIKEQDAIQRTISRLDMLFYVKIVDIFQINQLNRNILQLHRKTLAFYNMTILFSSILLISNIMACIFFQISQDSCFNPSVSLDGKSCWIIQTDIGGIPIIDQEWYVQYLYSLYWATTTMLGVGYGDVTPGNVREVSFTIMAEYIACAIFAFCINQVWQIFTEMREKETKHQRQFNIINRYMRDRKVKSIVSNKVQAYLTHYYRYEKKGDKEKQQEIIEDLAPAIKEELLMDSYGCVFKFKIFSKFSQELFETLVFKVQECRYPDGQIIQSPTFEQLNPSISYISKGSISSSIKVGKKTKQTQVFEKQTIFGEYEFITGQITSVVLTTDNYCSVYLLKSSQFVKELQGKDQQQYFYLKHSALYLNKLKDLNISCFFCENQQHISQQCCNRKLYANKYNVLKSFRTSTNMRSEFNRLRRRLGKKLVSKNEFGIIIKMIRKKLEYNIHEQPPINLTESYEVEHVRTESVIDKSLRGSDADAIIRGKSQMIPIASLPRRLVRSISMKDVEMYTSQAQNKIVSMRQYNISHLPFRELIIVEGACIDEIQNFEFYFSNHNIKNIVEKMLLNKGIRPERRL